MKRLCIAASVALCALLVLAAVGSATSTSTGNPKVDNEKVGCPGTGGTLTVDLDETFAPNLDPSYTNYAVVYRIDRGVFDSLVYEGADKKFYPWLATKWTVNKTATSFTFTLRKGVKFSDGTPLNARAVKFTLDRIESPAEQSLFAIGLLGPYKNSVVNSPYSVTVNFTKPYPPFLEAASQAFLGIVSPTAVEKLGSSFGQIPVGSGPFIITQNQPNLVVAEKRNPDYNWGPAGLKHRGAACVDGIAFKEVPTSSTRSGAILAGTVDAAETILPPDYQSMLKSGHTTLFVVPGAGFPYQISINVQNAPWNNTNVRIAFRDAIDIPTILKAVYGGEYIRAWGPISPNTEDYTPAVENTWHYDPKLSASLLDKQGWKMGSDGYRHKDGQTLTFKFAGQSPDRELRQEVMTYIQQYLKQVGIEMDITNYAGATYRLAMTNPANYDGTAGSTITASPAVLYQRFGPDQIPTSSYPGGANVSRVLNHAFDGWLAKATATGDPQEAQKYWSLVQTYLVKNAVSVPIELEPFILATRRVVHGMAFDVRDYPMYYGVYLKG